MRWRRSDIQDRIAELFGVVLHERSVGKLLRFAHVSTRLQHPKADVAAQTSFFSDLMTAVYEKVERVVWPNGPACVLCGEAHRIGLLKGKASRPGIYKCYKCRKQFRVTVGTIFQASHVPLHHWLQALYLMVSSKKA